nr:hypothetical protein [Tanacetum cinerariifolium]
MIKILKVAFPKDDPTKPCKLTAFFGYKAELHNETCEDVIIQTPPMVVVEVLQEPVQVKKKAFAEYSKKFEFDVGKKDIQSQLKRMKKYGTIIRVLAHTQAKECNITHVSTNGS